MERAAARGSQLQERPSLSVMTDQGVSVTEIGREWDQAQIEPPLLAQSEAAREHRPGSREVSSAEVDVAKPLQGDHQREPMVGSLRHADRLFTSRHSCLKLANFSERADQATAG